MKRTILLLLGMILLWTLQVNAQLSIYAVETDHTIDFETTVTGINEVTFDGTGFATTPTAGQLDADGWAVFGMSDGDKDFGLEFTIGDLARGASTGGETTGGVYAFEVETGNHSLGVQSTEDDFTSGWIGVVIQNNTGDSVNAISLSYDLWVLNDANRANSFNGEYSMTGNIWVPIDEFSFATTELKDAPAAWTKTIMSITDQDLGFTFYSGDSMFFRWYSDDVSGSGSRDEIAVDNITASFSYKECFPIASFPWTEDFDGDWTSWCWTVIDNDTDGTTWTQDDAYITPHSGEWTAHGTGNEDDYLITPEISITSANLLIEWYDVVESSSYNNTYDVLVSTTNTDPASFTDNLGTYDCTNTDWTMHTLDMSAYDGQNIYIAFHQTYSAATNYGFGIDDVTVRKLSSETDFLTYSFPEETGPAFINYLNHEIDIEVDFTADLTSLVAEFTLSTGATATVGGTPQESGVTANDFSAPVTYLVTAEDGTTTQDWTVTVTQAAPPIGANCSNPFTVELPGALPYIDAGQTNCGLGDIYSETSMDYYDGGEDAIYEITVTSDVVVAITLDPGTTAWTGVGIFESCPDIDLLMDLSTNTSASPHSIESVVLTAGTYYIMVDNYPTPYC
ncbi:MAG: choice-of-anchor J domain-containing protein, partial [Bacteroidota bacterium]|nr:choice-of-anchor J domain-containing protein [Bacteroidota bacterium]